MNCFVLMSTECLSTTYLQCSLEGLWSQEVSGHSQYRTSLKRVYYWFKLPLNVLLRTMIGPFIIMERKSEGQTISVLFLSQYIRGDVKNSSHKDNMNMLGNLFLKCM